MLSGDDRLSMLAFDMKPKQPGMLIVKEIFLDQFNSEDFKSLKL